MQEIVVINDDSVESFRAAEYAYNLAVTYEKNIVIVNIKATEEKKKIYSTVEVHDLLYHVISSDEISLTSDVGEHLRSLRRDHGFSPQVRPFSEAGCNEKKLTSYINSNPVWLIVMPAAVEENEMRRALKLNMQAVINRVQCPVMIIPGEVVQKPVERIVYLADLRYAQIPVLRYLAKFDKHDENIILAHHCASGLPELDRGYAKDLFASGLCNNVRSKRIFFTQMTERKMDVVVDAAIHGMQADLLVCVNRHFHFNELVGKNIMCKLPSYVNIPVLIFPN
ncbi:MAG: universal stress protein [Bacteroidetes bacterium]|nr:universal stress protein [Bacteroidota bacterium]